MMFLLIALLYSYLRRNPHLSSLAMYDIVDRPKSIPLLFLFSFFTPFEHAPSSDSPPLLVLSLLFFLSPSYTCGLLKSVFFLYPFLTLLLTLGSLWPRLVF